MKTFRQFLTEKIIEVDTRDIDMIYQPLDPIVKDFQKLLKIRDPEERERRIIQYGSKEYNTLYPEVLARIDSSRLRSVSAKLAHEINPIVIHVQRKVSSNSYNPTQKIMNIGPTGGAVGGLMVYNTIPTSNIRQFHSEFTELRFKATIRHELAHWLDDSLNNLHMSKISSLRNPQKFFEYLKAGQRSVSLGHIEVEAVVATIDEIKKRIGIERYDSLSWNELMDLHPALRSLNDTIGAPWRRKIASRLARERLLGKNMRF